MSADWGYRFPILTAPLKLGINVEKSQLGHKRVESGWRKGFCHNICLLMLSANMQKFDDTLLNFFSNQVTVYLYMLSPLVEDLVGSYLNGREVVTVQKKGLLVMNFEILQEMVKPLYLTSGGSNNTVFSFRRTLGNSLLFLRFLANGRITNIDYVSGYRSSSEGTSNLV